MPGIGLNTEMTTILQALSLQRSNRWQPSAAPPGNLGMVRSGHERPQASRRAQLLTVLFAIWMIFGAG